MREEQMRAQVTAEIAQVFVRPGRTRLPVQAGLGVLAIPAEPETVAIAAGGGFQRADALRDQRMLGLGDIGLERRRLASIRDPAAHGHSLGERRV